MATTDFAALRGRVDNLQELLAGLTRQDVEAWASWAGAWRAIQGAGKVLAWVMGSLGVLGAGAKGVLSLFELFRAGV